MKFSINQTELQGAISVVYKGISTRSTLPILSGIYIQAYKDTLTLQTTDLELSIKYTADTLIEEEGETVVPGRLFSDIVKSLPDAAVSLESTDQGLTIVCDASSFTIKTLDPQDFPGFPTVEAQQSVELPFGHFSSMVKKVARAVSKDESRAILTGILITIEEGRLRMVATDSYRLAIAETDLKEAPQEAFTAVISGRFLQDIVSLSQSDEYVSLALSENQIVVSLNNTVFINRRLEGNFPNYAQLLPESHEASASFEVEHFMSAVKRVSLLDEKTAPVKIDINIDSQTIQLSSVAQDIGSAQETLACEASGESMAIAFNHTYILDGLGSVDKGTVVLETQNSTRPGIFKSGKEESFLYLIMPVRI